MGEWVKLTEDSKFELEDHRWYLLAIKGYGTPMKGRYHCDIPHFEVLMHDNPMYIYCGVNGWGDITHYMEMPKLPWEVENNT